MIKYKELREEKGLSQADIGKILGITSQAYGLIENGKRDASTEYLKTSLLSKKLSILIQLMFGFLLNHVNCLFA